MSKSSVEMNDRRRVQLLCEDPSLTHQSFADECDIRNIMHKYKRTGIVTHMTSAKELLGDFTDVPDYRESLDYVIKAQAAFDTLPADLRKRFANDPAQFIDYCQNPDNRSEMIKFGMIDAVNNSTDSSKTSPQGEADPSST